MNKDDRFKKLIAEAMEDDGYKLKNSVNWVHVYIDRALDMEAQIKNYAAYKGVPKDVIKRMTKGFKELKKLSKEFKYAENYLKER